MADKIDFGDKYEDLEYVPSDSEDEYSKEEINLLKNVRKERKRKVEEEVLAFDESEDEDDSDNQLNHDSDLEDNEDDDIPDSKAWGKGRSQYYHTDFVDQDYSTYNEKDEELALQEEEEAKAIQKRLAKQLDEADFTLDIFTTNQNDEIVKETNESTKIKIKFDLEGVSVEKKLQLFKNDSPEFFGLTSDFEKYFKENQEVIEPFLDCVKDQRDLQIPIINFAETMNNVILTYSTNIAFYLVLKAQRISIKNHPVIKRLAQIRQILQQLEQKYNDNIKMQMLKAIELVQSGSNVIFHEVSKKSDNSLLSKKQVSFENSDSEENDGIEKDNEYVSDSEEKSDDERRGITYQIAKNKGLTPHRKKEFKNPRVKHKRKYQKALVRRKGAVRTVRKELKRYSGEISGIKIAVKKGIKIKN